MSKSAYQVVFLGKIAKGQDSAQVKKRLARLFQKQATQIEKMFAAGKPLVIKKDLSRNQAKQLLKLRK